MIVVWLGVGITILLLAALAGLAWAGSSKLMARRTPNPQTSPADHGLAYEDVHFQSRDGLRLGGWFIPANSARGTVIFCHGHAGSMDPDVVSDGGFARVESAVVGWGLEHGLPRWLALPVARLIITAAQWRLGVRLSDADPIRWVARIAPRAVFFIHGDQDSFVTITDVEALYARSGEPKALWRVAEAQHRRIDRVRPAEYRKRVINFFEGHLASTADNGRASILRQEY
jgi:fermentation-respiration switch protein FrsA (DUF1100 family)